MAHRRPRQIRLGKGEEVSAYQLADGSVRQFPFRLSLDSFTVAYYREEKCRVIS